MAKSPIVNGLKQCRTCHQWKTPSEFRIQHNECKACAGLRFKNWSNTPEGKKRIWISQHKPDNIEKAKKRRQTPRARELANKIHAKYRANPVYHLKELEYKKDYREQPDKWARIIKYNRDRALKLKEEAIAYKGGKCSICGYSKCTSALEFHHLDPEKKEGYEGRRSINKMASLATNKAELDKCILVCSNCHREIHAGVANLQ